MKLVISIVNSDDGHILLSRLTKAGFYVTKLSTSGGFLRSGNITLMTGVEEERVDELIEIIGKCSSKRKQMVQPNPMYGNELYVSAPMEITVGGATVFVLDVDNFYKL